MSAWKFANVLKRLWLAGALAGSLAAEVSLAPLFTDHAVLQRRTAVPIWGRANPGEPVTVRFREHTVRAITAADGSWRVALPPMEAGDPAELVAEGKNTVRCADVVVGEVWLCSGQSNMAFRLEELEQREIVAAATDAGIRHFAVAFATAAAPAATVRGTWRTAAPDASGKFSAIGYFFARQLRERLGVPVGLLNASIGGTQIESWMSAEALAADPAFAVVHARWAAVLADFPRRLAEHKAELAKWEAASGRERVALARQGRRKPLPPSGAGHRDAPSSLFNAMVHPLVPYAVRGILWDQGGSNAARAGEYAALFKAHITDWRARWGDAQLPFLFVQDRNYRDPQSPGDHRAKLREAQAAALALPATGMAVTIDIGASDDPHPRNKAEEGRRLALLALAGVYGEAVVPRGPLMRSIAAEGAIMRVRFDTAGAKLTTRRESLRGFEVAGADGAFFPADARIEGDAVLVNSPQVARPVAVRYAWGDDPVGDLQNDAGLPAAPFRSAVANP
jgi:sialate O-acetylesterase